MPVIVNTSFEDIPNGVPPNEEDTLEAVGWDVQTSSGGVVTANARSGVKSVRIFDGPLSWPVGVSHNERAIIVYGYFRRDSSLGSGDGAGVRVQSDIGGNEISARNFGGDNILRIFVDGVEVAASGNVLAELTYQKVSMHVLMSTVLPDLSDFAADGYVRVYVNDVEVVSYVDQRVFCYDGALGANQNSWSRFHWSVDGNIDDVYAYYEANEIPVDNSDPCCGQHSDPPSGETSAGDVPIALQPWIPECPGGGEVELAADVIDTVFWDL